MPLGDMTPTIKHDLVRQKALELRNAMSDCILSDAVIELVALRVNTGAPVAKLAKAVGLKPHSAYVALARPQAQALIADLAKALMGQAAIEGVHTMQRLMRGSDHALAYRAAEQMMERAGLGLSQRSTPDGKANTVFQFAFGAPQAVKPLPSDVAPALGHAQMGPTPDAAAARYPSKTAASGSGEAPAPVILQPGAAQQSTEPLPRLRSASAKR